MRRRNRHAACSNPITLNLLKMNNHLATTRIFFLSSLAFLLFIVSCGNNPQSPSGDAHQATPGQIRADTFVTRLAALRGGPDSTEILFTSRQAFYKIASRDTLLFTGNHKAGEPLKVVADSLHYIIAVLPLSDEEAREAKAFFADSIQSAFSAVIDLDKVDTSIFNHPERNPDFKKWQRDGCLGILPDIATAQQIFEYCQRQTCTYPVTDVVPCIPFQYVTDGCYARAHKMRWIIENLFHYCSQKIFSFANQGADKLDVWANKWGGCCVEWWYHVAPMVYVNVNGIGMSYVIDPGMFNGPVSIYDWLVVQQNTACNPRAHVSKYSIVASTAYQPVNKDGVSFTQDPNYVLTNRTLILYKNGVTCR